jgi:hypothetical protein
MKDTRKPYTTKDPTENLESNPDSNQNGIILRFTPEIPKIPEISPREKISKKCWPMNP